RTAGRTLLFARLTVAASLAGLLVFADPFLRSMAYGGGAAVLIDMLAPITLPPPPPPRGGPRRPSPAPRSPPGGAKPAARAEPPQARFAPAVWAEPVAVLADAGADRAA